MRFLIGLGMSVHLHPARDDAQHVVVIEGARLVHERPPLERVAVRVGEPNANLRESNLCR
jgi:hypothetical protein